MWCLPVSADVYFPARSACPRHELFPGVVTTTCWGERLMLSLVELAPGAVVEEHHHPHEQAGLVLEGQARFIIGGVERILGPGDRFVIPSNVPHKVIVLDQPCRVLDAFSPPREVYK